MNYLFVVFVAVAGICIVAQSDPDGWKIPLQPLIIALILSLFALFLYHLLKLLKKDDE